MSAMPPDGPQIEVRSDDDWKERVKAEDRRRDEQAAATQPPPRAEATAPSDRLPRADFSVLVQLFTTQAMTALGVIPSPGAKQPQQQLPLARHFIDLLGVLEQKCRGNLTPQEEKMLTTSLHELRLAYVELSRRPAEAPPQASS